MASIWLFCGSHLKETRSKKLMLLWERREGLNQEKQEEIIRINKFVELRDLDASGKSYCHNFKLTFACNAVISRGYYITNNIFDVTYSLEHI